MRPLVANYYLTYRCNASCVFCNIWREDPIENESDTETVKKHLSELKSLGIAYLDITGGEPLLREDLPEILKAAKEKKLFTSVTTNCVLYPDMAKDITGNIDRLIFSLDSPFSDEHDTLRGTSAFDKFLESVRIAKSLGKAPVVNFTVTRDSVGSLPEMIELIEGLNVLLWINPVFDFEDFGKFEPESIEYIKYYSGKKNVSMNLAALELLKAGGNFITRPRCRAYDATVTISPDGSLIIPCFKNKSGKTKIERSIKETLERSKETGKREGKMDICGGCTMWTYMIPSFLYKIDRYFFLNLWSLFDLYRKDYKLNKGGKK